MKLLLSESQVRKIIEMSVSAYHGSPHNIEKFDTNKIGSGESTQWFGWGLYFTDVKDIANWYASSVPQAKNEDTKDNFDLYFKGKKFGVIDLRNVNQFTGVKGKVIKSESGFFSENGGDQERLNISNDDYFRIARIIQNQLFNYLRYLSGKFDTQNIESWDNFKFNPPKSLMQQNVIDWEDLSDEGKQWLLDTFGNVKESDLEIKSRTSINKSYTYHVTLHKGKTPDQYDWLSWYDNLTESQKGKILSGIKREKLKNRVYYVARPEDDENEIQPKYFHNILSAKEYAKKAKKITPFGFYVNTHEVVKQSFNALESIHKTANEFYNELSGLFGSPKEASMFLLRCGIDGIKYPTESMGNNGSRGFNYVVFDSSAITIEKRDETDIK